MKAQHNIQKHNTFEARRNHITEPPQLEHFSSVRSTRPHPPWVAGVWVGWWARWWVGRLGWLVGWQVGWLISPSKSICSRFVVCFRSGWWWRVGIWAYLFRIYLMASPPAADPSDSRQWLTGDLLKWVIFTPQLSFWIPWGFILGTRTPWGESILFIDFRVQVRAPSGIHLGIISVIFCDFAKVADSCQAHFLLIWEWKYCQNPTAVCVCLNHIKTQFVERFRFPSYSGC